MPAHGHADLPLMQKRSPCPGAHCGFDINVVQYDKGILATELEVRSLEQAARYGADLLANPRGSREADHVDKRIPDQRVTRFRATGKDMEQPLGQPRSLEQPRIQDAATDRRLRIGLEQYCVAGGQRRCDGSRRKYERGIPRGNDPDHAHWNSARYAMPPPHVACRDHPGWL